MIRNIILFVTALAFLSLAGAPAHAGHHEAAKEKGRAMKEAKADKGRMAVEDLRKSAETSVDEARENAEATADG